MHAHKIKRAARAASVSKGAQVCPLRKQELRKQTYTQNIYIHQHGSRKCWKQRRLCFIPQSSAKHDHSHNPKIDRASQLDARIICFMDADCLPEPGWVEAMEAAQKGSPGIVSGCTVSSAPDSAIGRPFNL